MMNRYRLESLKDDVLVAALPKLVAQDNEQAADLLAYLGELDARRLYEEIGRGFAKPIPNRLMTREGLTPSP